MRFLTNPDIQASVFNTGGLFFGGPTTSGDGYLIPRTTGNSPVFAAGFWLGGQVDGELRVAAARYGTYNFWPGPLEDAASPPTDCSAYDRIFVVSRDDIRRYYETGVPTDDLRDWPHQLGAPVLDGDGDSTNYDLRAGDQPDLIGDMAAWWVMNDAGNEHPAGGSTPPMGVEVRVQAFAYGYTQETTSPVLAQSSFYRYEIINRGEHPIDNVYASIFVDPDLGGAGDDYIGTDTLRNMVFVYNSDEEDSAYGIPPAMGAQVLQGPLVEGVRLGMTATSTVIGGGPAGTVDPSTAEQYYNFMRGLWGDGTPISAFGQGYQTNGPATTFIYPGDPVEGTFWSEMNVDGNGGQSPFGDRRMIVSTGPFSIPPDTSQTLLFALPFGQGTDWLNSVTVLRSYASALQRVHADGFFTSRPVEGRPLVPSYALALSRARPNPSRQPEVLLTLPEAARVRATVYDVRGRQLEVIVDGELPEGETTMRLPDGLVPGTYLLQVEVAPGAVETLSFTVVR